MIAALFVETDGCYFNQPGVDPWDITRDARTYPGPHPVVAHPPCARWSRLARFCEVRHGLKVGDDGGCFAAAVAAVHKYGGVIEHPAFSKAWEKFGLPRPATKVPGWQGDADSGFSCYIEQGRYGHVAKKATWLYAYGVPLKALPQLRWGHTPDSKGTGGGGMDTWRNLVGNSAAASATPTAFRDVLIQLANLSTQDLHAEN